MSAHVKTIIVSAAFLDRARTRWWMLVSPVDTPGLTENGWVRKRRANRASITLGGVERRRDTARRWSTREK